MKTSSYGTNKNNPGGRWHRGGVDPVTGKITLPRRSSGSKDTDNTPAGTGVAPNYDLAPTRQQERARLFQVAYADTKTSFPKMPRRERRKLSRYAASSIQRAYSARDNAMAAGK